MLLLIQKKYITEIFVRVLSAASQGNFFKCCFEEIVRRSQFGKASFSKRKNPKSISSTFEKNVFDTSIFVKTSGREEQVFCLMKKQTAQLKI